MSPYLYLAVHLKLWYRKRNGQQSVDIVVFGVFAAEENQFVSTEKEPKSVQIILSMLCYSDNHLKIRDDSYGNIKLF